MKYVFNLSGVTFDSRQLLIKDLKEGTRVILITDEYNPHDKYAIKVVTEKGMQIGFVPKTVSKDLFYFVKNGLVNSATILEKLGGINQLNYGLRIEVITMDDDVESNSSIKSLETKNGHLIATYENGFVKDLGILNVDANEKIIETKVSDIKNPFLFSLKDDGTYEIFSNANCDVEELIIPEYYKGRKVTSIGYGSFRKIDSLVSVVIPKTIETIGEYCFSRNDKLQNISFSEGLREIKKGAFSYCNKINNIALPNSLEMLAWSSFDESCIMSITGLNGLCIKEGLFADTQIGNLKEFGGCLYLSADGNPFYYLVKCISSLSNIQIHPDTKVIAHNSFKNKCDSSRIVFPNGLLEIHSNAFYDCKRLKEIMLPPSLKYLNGFSCTSIKNLCVPISVEKIGHGSFYGCESLISVSFCNSLQDIDDSAFGKCTSLKEIAFPNSLKTIGKDCFAKCRELIVTHFSDNLEVIGPGAFAGCTKAITTTNGIFNYIGDSKNLHFLLASVSNVKRNERFLVSTETRFIDINVFRDYLFHNGYAPQINFDNFKISKNLLPFDANDKYLICSFNSFDVSEENNYFKSINGILFSKNEKVLFAYPHGINNYSYEIPNTVEEISHDAFFRCESLRKVIIGKNVKRICSGSFAACKNIESMIIEAPITKLEWNTLGDCEKLSFLQLSDTIETIAPYMLFNNKALKKVILPRNLKKIYLTAFKNCEALCDIVFKNTANWYLFDDVDYIQRKIDFDGEDIVKLFKEAKDSIAGSPYLLKLDN